MSIPANIARRAARGKKKKKKKKKKKAAQVLSRARKNQFPAGLRKIPVASLRKLTFLEEEGYERYASWVQRTGRTK